MVARAAAALAVARLLRPAVLITLTFALGIAQGTNQTRLKETVLTKIRGEFSVQLKPVAVDEGGEPALGRMLIDKQFHGDLEAVSKGQMLAFRTAVEGSAGYVAMEKVSGRLEGRTGTFVLQHSGTMDRGAASLVLTVVPDSGTAALAGLTGRMAIEITGGKHFYSFEYSLPKPE